MLSQGRPGIDHIFSLSEGVLRLEVDKATFERIGLEGKAMPKEGRKHVKARYGELYCLGEVEIEYMLTEEAIELNLRLPSMVRGKKGFERIVWAFKNVLNQSLTWLFVDLKGANDGTGPIAAHAPKVKAIEPQIRTIEAVLMPQLPLTLQEHEYAEATELLEWLSLVMSGSPRIRKNDNIDAYLSRYRPPTPSATEDLVHLHWHGFISPSFVQRVLQSTLKGSGENWFAMSAAAFDGKAYTFLHREHHTLTWEYQD